jgi:hypothetical protein
MIFKLESDMNLIVLIVIKHLNEEQDWHKHPGGQILFSNAWT